jgi:signal transduction histidine kinase
VSGGEGSRLRVACAVVGTAAAMAGLMLAYASGEPASATIVNFAICLTYLYGGLLIWARDPGNRTGPLMTAIALTWYLASLASTGVPGLVGLGVALGDTPTALLFILVLTYPTGRFDRASDRVAAIGLAVGITALNALQLVPVPIWINVNPNGYVVGLGLTLIATTLTIRRWVMATPEARRDLLPVLVAGGVLGVTLLLNSVRRIFDVPEDVGGLLLAIKDAAPAAIPIALLIGFYRQSEHRLQALIDAIPDRMLRFGRDGRFLEPRRIGDAARRTSPSSAAAQRLHELMVAEVGQAVAGSVDGDLEAAASPGHEFSLQVADDRRDFEARFASSGPDEVTAIVRDFTDQRAAEAELRRSRARIVEATDAVRRRLERDLHDGAQQRLVSASLALRLMRSRLGSADGSNEEVVAAADAAAAALRIAIQELRELARGIHPAILTEAGLGAAITALADRSSVPAAVSSLPDRRLSASVEATAYFVVSEALANVAKYASASHASIGADCVGPTLRVEIGDDGVGGADGSRGTGIRGLQDRVAAVGGRLTIDSPLGRGTRLVAEIPIG